MKPGRIWQRFVLLLLCHGLATLGLAAPQLASHWVTLTWTPATQPAGVTIGSWNVYRSTVSSGLYNLLSSVPVAILKYTDFSVAAGGMYSYVVTSVDTAGVESVYSVSATATIPLGAPLSVATTMLPATVIGTTYSVLLSAAGGNPSYTWAGSGVPGLTVSAAGLFSGTPTQFGTFTLSLTVSDSTGATASASIPVVVALPPPPPVSVTTTALPPTEVGATYSVLLSAAGGNPPYTWAGSGVPGLTMSSAGLLSGAPTQSGTFTLSFTASDSTGATASASIPVVVAPSTPGPVSIGKVVLHVDCVSTNEQISSINNALASLDPSQDNTIYVQGACKENVTITGFDRLQLIAQNGASISDASDDTAPALSIDNSTRVSVQGFIINGNGPNAKTEAIDCTFSYCAFSGNTVQGGADGVDVFRGARASFNGDVLQNNTSGAGIFVGQNAFVLATSVTSQINGQGANVVGGFLQTNSSMVQNNSGDGIVVNLGGTANLFTSTVTGNLGNGISLVGHSTLQLGLAGNGTGAPGSSLTNNSGAGILIMDLSFANFPNGVTNVVSGNGGSKDVICRGQYPATRGANTTNLGGGTTNCDF
jgi:Putative Ig domain